MKKTHLPVIPVVEETTDLSQRNEVSVESAPSTAGLFGGFGIFFWILALFFIFGGGFPILGLKTEE